MDNTTAFSVVCTEMGPHEATLRYTGAMCQAGALALEYQFERLFGYFQYRRIRLLMESPGGAVDGLQYVLRVMKKWARQGRVVAVGSTFQCASAAAFLLSMGEWGKRRVDRGTLLLFHNARLEGSSFAQVTAELSTTLSQALSSVDSKLLDMMVDKMLFETGSAKTWLTSSARAFAMWTCTGSNWQANSRPSPSHSITNASPIGSRRSRDGRDRSVIRAGSCWR